MIGVFSNFPLVAMDRFSWSCYSRALEQGFKRMFTTYSATRTSSSVSDTAGQYLTQFASERLADSRNTDEVSDDGQKTVG